MEGRWEVIWIEVHKGTCLYLEDILVYILLPFLFGVTSVARILERVQLRERRRA